MGASTIDRVDSHVKEEASEYSRVGASACTKAEASVDIVSCALDRALCHWVNN